MIKGLDLGDERTEGIGPDLRPNAFYGFLEAEREPNRSVAGVEEQISRCEIAVPKPFEPATALLLDRRVAVLIHSRAAINAAVACERLRGRNCRTGGHIELAPVNDIAGRPGSNFN